MSAEDCVALGLDELLAQQRGLRVLLPNVWNAFFARFGRLRPIQVAAIPRIIAGRNILITAPTAGGKTEAVAAPICENALRERWPGLSILLITPTRALVNDLYHRLEPPCREAGLVAIRKTSDHPLSDTTAANFLITTPESVESLLTFRRDRLKDIRAVIIDEVHLLDGSPRGDQLMFLMHRLRAFLKYVRTAGDETIQSIGISATISNPAATAQRYLGNTAELVAVSGHRLIEAEIIVAAGTDAERAESVAAGAERFADVHKTLIFVNSRKQADQAMLYQRGLFARVPVFGHHGNLSREERERTESRFKDEPRAVCVATMTLEVGIDIGDVDLVVCLDPPFGLASFLQRIGRGCRRLKGGTRVLCIARDEADRLIFEALIWQAKSGMPAVAEPPIRRSVILQQVLAYLRQVPENRRTADQFSNALGWRGEPTLARLASEVLEDMASTGLLAQRNGVYEPASDGREFIESSRIYSNIAPTAEIELVDADSGQSVAKVAGIDSSSSGVRIAGRSFELLPGGSGRIQKVRAQGDAIVTPRYSSRSLPYACDVGIALAAYLQIQAHVVFVIERTSGLMAMTWLGRLMNLALANLLKNTGIGGKAGAFGLLMSAVGPADAITVLRNAILSSAQANPFRFQNLDAAADLGPHLACLSEAGQSQARCDFFNRTFLETWISRITECRVIDPTTEIGEQLQALSIK